MGRPPDKDNAHANLTVTALIRSGSEGPSTGGIGTSKGELLGVCPLVEYSHVRFQRPKLFDTVFALGSKLTS